VIVTGACSGIGARAVQRLHADGAQVVAADIDPRVAETYAGHARVVPMCGDVTADGFAASLVEQAVDRFGGVDRLSHCAGIMPGGRV
jgi:NAD(P)-dependent dehydrogenase (short-subunit alcohol dehydrogenase family)